MSPVAAARPVIATDNFSASALAIAIAHVALAIVPIIGSIESVVATIDILIPSWPPIIIGASIDMPIKPPENPWAAVLA